MTDFSSIINPKRNLADYAKSSEEVERTNNQERTGTLKDGKYTVSCPKAEDCPDLFQANAEGSTSSKIRNSLNDNVREYLDEKNLVVPPEVGEALEQQGVAPDESTAKTRNFSPNVENDGESRIAGQDGAGGNAQRNVLDLDEVDISDLNDVRRNEEAQAGRRDGRAELNERQNAWAKFDQEVDSYIEANKRKRGELDAAQLEKFQNRLHNDDASAEKVVVGGGKIVDLDEDEAIGLETVVVGSGNARGPIDLDEDDEETSSQAGSREDSHDNAALEERNDGGSAENANVGAEQPQPVAQGNVNEVEAGQVEAGQENVAKAPDKTYAGEVKTYIDDMLKDLKELANAPGQLNKAATISVKLDKIYNSLIPESLAEGREAAILQKAISYESFMAIAEDIAAGRGNIKESLSALHEVFSAALLQCEGCGDNEKLGFLSELVSQLKDRSDTYLVQKNYAKGLHDNLRNAMDFDFDAGDRKMMSTSFLRKFAEVTFPDSAFGDDKTGKAVREFFVEEVLNRVIAPSSQDESEQVKDWLPRLSNVFAEMAEAYPGLEDLCGDMASSLIDISNSKLRESRKEPADVITEALKNTKPAPQEAAKAVGDIANSTLNSRDKQSAIARMLQRFTISLVGKDETRDCRDAIKLIASKLSNRNDRVACQDGLERLNELFGECLEHLNGADKEAANEKINTFLTGLKDSMNVNLTAAEQQAVAVEKNQRFVTNLALKFDHLPKDAKAIEDFLQQQFTAAFKNVIGSDKHTEKLSSIAQKMVQGGDKFTEAVEDLRTLPEQSQPPAGKIFDDFLVAIKDFNTLKEAEEAFGKDLETAAKDGVGGPLNSLSGPLFVKAFYDSKYTQRAALERVFLESVSDLEMDEMDDFNKTTPCTRNPFVTIKGGSSDVVAKIIDDKVLGENHKVGVQVFGDATHWTCGLMNGWTTQEEILLFCCGRQNLASLIGKGLVNTTGRDYRNSARFDYIKDWNGALKLSSVHGYAIQNYIKYATANDIKHSKPHIPPLNVDIIFTAMPSMGADNGSFDLEGDTEYLCSNAERSLGMKLMPKQRENARKFIDALYRYQYKDGNQNGTGWSKDSFANAMKFLMFGERFDLVNVFSDDTEKELDKFLKLADEHSVKNNKGKLDKTYFDYLMDKEYEHGSAIFQNYKATVTAMTVSWIKLASSRGNTVFLGGAAGCGTFKNKIGEVAGFVAEAFINNGGNMLYVFPDYAKRDDPNPNVHGDDSNTLEAAFAKAWEAKQARERNSNADERLEEARKLQHVYDTNAADVLIRLLREGKDRLEIQRNLKSHRDRLQMMLRRKVENGIEEKAEYDERIKWRIKQSQELLTSLVGNDMDTAELQGLQKQIQDDVEDWLFIASQNKQDAVFSRFDNLISSLNDPEYPKLETFGEKLQNRPEVLGTELARFFRKIANDDSKTLDDKTDVIQYLLGGVYDELFMSKLQEFDRAHNQAGINSETKAEPRDNDSEQDEDRQEQVRVSQARDTIRDNFDSLRTMAQQLADTKDVFNNVVALNLKVNLGICLANLTVVIDALPENLSNNVKAFCNAFTETYKNS